MANDKLTKHSTWSGIPVSIDGNGTFYAKVDDIEIQNVQLSAVRTKIDAALKPSAKKVAVSLPVLVISEGKLEATTITGISRASRELQFNPPIAGPIRRYSQRVIADTPQNRTLAETFIATAAAAEKARAALGGRAIEVNGHGRIEIEQYGGLIATLKAAHAKSGKP